MIMREAKGALKEAQQSADSTKPQLHRDYVRPAPHLPYSNSTRIHSRCMRRMPRVSRAFRHLYAEAARVSVN